MGQVVVDQGEDRVKLHHRRLQRHLGVVLLDDEVVHHEAMLISQLHRDCCVPLILTAFSDDEILKQKSHELINHDLSGDLTPVSLRCSIWAASSLSTVGRNQIG